MHNARCLPDGLEIPVAPDQSLLPSHEGVATTGHEVEASVLFADVAVFGDTVNAASRIEAANKEAGTRLLVSDEVLGHLGDRARVGRTVQQVLRGKSGTHTLHEVLEVVGP